MTLPHEPTNVDSGSRSANELRSKPLFSRPTLAVLTIVTVFSLVATVVLAAFGPRNRPDIEIPGTHNRTAIGHAALVDLLRALDVPVLVSRSRSAGKAGPDDLLVLAEPSTHVSGNFEERLEEAFESANRVLLVLPKWRGSREPLGSRLSRAYLVDADTTRSVAEAVDAGGVVRRTGSPAGPWTFDPSFAPGFADAPSDPDIVQPQLLDSSRLEPLIDQPAGILFGRLPAPEEEAARRFVVTDADLFSNHGLARSDNAWLAVSILTAALGPGGTVVIDESFHGATAAESAFQALFRMPLGIATAHLALLLGIVLAARVARFGAPLPPDPPVERTPGFRIRNTAALLRAGGHDAAVLERYRRETFDELAAALHLSGGPRRELAERLDEVRDRLASGPRKAGRSTPSAAELQQRVRDFRSTARGADAPAFLEIARDLHRFREEMLDGTRHRP